MAERCTMRGEYIRRRLLVEDVWQKDVREEMSTSEDDYWLRMSGRKMYGKVSISEGDVRNEDILEKAVREEEGVYPKIVYKRKLCMGKMHETIGIISMGSEDTTLFG